MRVPSQIRLGARSYQRLYRNSDPRRSDGLTDEDCCSRGFDRVLLFAVIILLVELLQTIGYHGRRCSASHLLEPSIVRVI